MKVTKLVYKVRDEIPQKEYDILKEVGVIQFTDYETCEITSDNLINTLEEINADTEHVEYRYLTSEVTQALESGLGSEIAKALIEQEIDLVMIIY